MSYLIVGGQEEERKEKAQNFAQKYKASPFDTIWVEDKESIGIEQIRELERKLCLKPFNSPVKIAIIHPGELLTLEAQNALLKTLEEAQESNILILTAPHQEVLLPTVVSRCQVISLPIKPTHNLDQAGFETCLGQLLSIKEMGVGDRLRLAGKIAEEEEIDNWLKTQLIILHELILCQSGVFSPTSQSLKGQGEKLAMFSQREVAKAIKNLEDTLSKIEQNVNPRLALEIFLLDLPYSKE
jgi:DNA polymerase-3 subunit delta'